MPKNWQKLNSAPPWRPAKHIFHRLDNIVLDLVFGGKPLGFQFLKWLKATPGIQAIPVLVCTASVVLDKEEEHQIKALECAFIAKPFDLDALLAAVAECLGPQKS